MNSSVLDVLIVDYVETFNSLNHRAAHYNDIAPQVESFVEKTLKQKVSIETISRSCRRLRQEGKLVAYSPGFYCTYKFFSKPNIVETEDEYMAGLADFIKNENQKLEQEARDFKEKNTFPGFWVPNKGENSFEITLDQEPRQKDFGNGLRKIFRIQVSGKDFDWAINPKNPVYRELLQRLGKGQNSFVLLCTGSGKETRYEFLDKKVV